MTQYRQFANITVGGRGHPAGGAAGLTAWSASRSAPKRLRRLPLPFGAGDGKLALGAG